jgi:predicted TIM-barrel fold metal-dependent hydrolase
MTETVTSPASARHSAVTWPIYSADDHLDLWAMPVDVWSARVPSRFVDACPHVETIDGTPWWVAGDRPMMPRSDEVSARLSAIARAGERDDIERISTPELRLRDMERDGVYASVIYGPIGGATGVDDAEARPHFFRAWNDFAADYSAVAPGRLAVTGALPLDSPDEAAREFERCAALGLKGVLVNPFLIDYRAPEWDLVWSVADETGIPVCFHLGGGTSRLDPMAKGWEWAAHRSVLPMQLDEPLAALVMNGALDRHPGFTLVLAEAGAGWLPYIVYRMDEAVERRSHLLADQGFALSCAPSEIFKRQVMVSFEQEPNGTTLIPLVGTDRFMWGSDYPHLDSTWPESAAAIDVALGGLDEVDRRLITADNCRRTFHLE